MSEDNRQTPRLLTVARDVVTFMLGLAIILKQAGIGFEPPDKISLELLAIGALCCNVPGILHVIGWRYGQSNLPTTSPPGAPQVSPQSPSPSGPSSTTQEAS